MSTDASSQASNSFVVESTVNGKSIYYGRDFREGYDIVLAFNDIVEFLQKVPGSSADLVLTSPHYNLGKVYEERIGFEQYLQWQKSVISQCVNILRPEGSICWEVGNYVHRGEIFPLDIYFYDIFKGLGLKLRNRIVWHFGHGLHSRRRFSGRYETILWFTKGEDYTFNLDAVRVPQKYPGKRAYRGPNKGKPTSNPLGKNPSDFWVIALEDWESGVWRIPNVKSNHPEKTIHPAQFPIELAERLVLALTDKNNLVFDPFMGVGSSLIAAALHDRRGIGVDKEKIYVDIAYQRISAALNGTLKRRPFGKPIYEPRGTEKVAQIPPEWKTRQQSSGFKSNVS